MGTRGWPNKRWGWRAVVSVAQSNYSRGRSGLFHLASSGWELIHDGKLRVKTSNIAVQCNAIHRRHWRAEVSFDNRIVAILLLNKPGGGASATQRLPPAMYCNGCLPLANSRRAGATRQTSRTPSRVPLILVNALPCRARSNNSLW